MNDQYYMSCALELAQKGCGYVNPNPMVGAIIVKDGQIIAEGYHTAYGKLHAEREAIAACNSDMTGATMYVTLEPCCHHGKTPPCTDAIIESGIIKVVIGALDPNHLVSGKGASILHNAGIQTVVGVLNEECERLNEVFFHYIKSNLPFIALKYAMTMDGKIATASGASKWITGEDARYRVHQDRNRYSAIMVGVSTVIQDDPLLNCRIDGGKDPIRIICDTNLRTPIESQIIQTANEIPTILATCCIDQEKQEPYMKRGCQIIEAPSANGHVDLSVLMRILGERSIDSVLIEGGSEIHWSALNAGIVNRVQTYLAPKIFGGTDALSPIGGYGVNSPDLAYQLINTRITELGDDYLIESEVDYVHRNY